MNFLAMKDSMAEQVISNVAANMNISVVTATVILGILVIWSSVWKLLGLWKSARKGSVVWFIVLAVFNTMGILPILYIYVFSEMKSLKLKKTVKKKPAKKTKAKKRK